MAAPTTSAPAVAAPPPANRVEPADPGLQVDFDDEEEEEKEPTPKKAARLPVTARLQRPPAAKVCARGGVLTSVEFDCLSLPAVRAEQRRVVAGSCRMWVISVGCVPSAGCKGGC